MGKDSLAKYLMLAGAATLGALTMYFFDPERGRGRRAVCMDRLSSAAGEALDAAKSESRDLKNTTKGVLAEAKSAVERGLSRERETGGELEAA